jgi:hypothetical protein
MSQRRSYIAMLSDAEERHFQWQQRLMTFRVRAHERVWIEPAAHPDYRAWHDLAQKRGRDPDDVDFTYYMNRSLLSELIHAAMGLRHAELRLREALSVAQTEYDQASAALLPSGDAMAPDYHHSYGGPGVWAASFALRTR